MTKTDEIKMAELDDKEEHQPKTDKCVTCHAHLELPKFLIVNVLSPW